MLTVLLWFASRRREVSFPWAFWLFGVFLLGFGFTHLLGVVAVFRPLDSLVGAVKLGTALLALATVLALVPLARRARVMRSPADLEREIEERKRAEAAVAEERNLLRSLIDNLPDMVYVKDAQSRYVLDNLAHRRLLGADSPEGVRGKTVFDFYEKDLAARYFADDQAVITSGQPLVHQVEPDINPAGIMSWHAISKMPLRDSQGQVVGLVGIGRDITEQKRAEDALAASERRYRQLTEAALDAIVVADQGGRITLFNPAAERMFGYAAAEVLGQPLTTLMPPNVRERHEQGFRRYLETRQSRIVGHTVELVGRRKDGGEFPLELSLSALDVGGELQFLGAIRDLTERDRLRAAMVQSEKLASIGLLSAGVAHEINNPLAFIANNLTVLERDTKGLLALVNTCDGAVDRLAQSDAETASRFHALAEKIDLPYVRDNLGRVLARTREGVQRVTRIVGSLRGLARTAPPQLEETHVPDLVDMSLDMIRGQLQRRGIAVELDLVAAPKLRCVATQISQVLLNLVVNAMQAIEAAGRTEGGRIRINSRREGPELLIEVVDNGCGIAPEDLPRLFDPFFTTKPVGEGTGLGLFVTHGIINGHGGRIVPESRPGEGSCFRVFLPLDPKRGPA
jgi:PAS domain S-box-containing protein